VNNSPASTRDGLVLAADDGPAFWFLDTLTLTKVSGGDTGGGFTVLDHRCPPGFAPPPHIHRYCDEAFFILEGQFDGFCGERLWNGGPGTLVFLPRGVPHGFRVSELGQGRTLLILGPAGFDAFVADVGEPAERLVLPEPARPDPARVAELAAAHGIELLPPQAG
jgi:mannose-6-phosphate isomerase-like protein (cupin superfamily)